MTSWKAPGRCQSEQSKLSLVRWGPARVALDELVVERSDPTGSSYHFDPHGSVAGVESSKPRKASRKQPPLRDCQNPSPVTQPGSSRHLNRGARRVCPGFEDSTPATLPNICADCEEIGGLYVEKPTQTLQSFQANKLSIPITWVALINPGKEWTPCAGAADPSVCSVLGRC